MKINAHTRITASELDVAEKYAAMLTADIEFPLDDAIAFNKLIKLTLIPGVEAAKKQLDKVAAVASTKIRAWALVHLNQAKQLNRDTALFQKLLNDPLAAAKQLARHLLGVPAATHSAEDKKLDDLLLDIAF